jgi:hypothetical protein
MDGVLPSVLGGADEKLLDCCDVMSEAFEMIGRRKEFVDNKDCCKLEDDRLCTARV